MAPRRRRAAPALPRRTGTCRRRTGGSMPSVQQDAARERCVLLLSCADRPGIVAAVAGFIAERGGNIVHSEQHTESGERIFFQRVEFELDGFSVEKDAIAEAFAPIADRFAMAADIRFTADRQRLAVLVSR